MRGLKTGVAVAVLLCLSSSVSFSQTGPAGPAGNNECNITSGIACPTPANGAAIFDVTGNNTTGFYGVRSDPGAAIGAIDVYNICRYVDNNSSPAISIFVPFKSAIEWQSFYTNTPSFMSLKTCARPYTVTVTPNASCASPSPATINQSLPYARTGTQQNVSVNFTCTVVGQCGACGCGADQTWTQTVTSTYTALNSDVTSPSWQLANTVYGGTAPSPASAPACGPGPSGPGPCIPNGSTSPVSGGCSVSCGGGTETITVFDSCGTPTGSYSQACNTQACAGPSCIPNGSTSSVSGGCSVSCGGGTETITVTDSCGGVVNSYSQACNTQACLPACTPTIPGFYDAGCCGPQEHCWSQVDACGNWLPGAITFDPSCPGP